MTAMAAGCSATVPADEKGTVDGSSQAANRAMEGVDVKERLPKDIRRAFIIVRDMEGSLAFYRNVRGLEVNTDDAEKACEAAVKLDGVTMTGPTRLHVYPGRGGRPDINVRGCNVFDPNGVAVEINQPLN